MKVKEKKIPVCKKNTQEEITDELVERILKATSIISKASQTWQLLISICGSFIGGLLVLFSVYTFYLRVKTVTNETIPVIEKEIECLKQVDRDVDIQVVKLWNKIERNESDIKDLKTQRNR